ncbi:hypothetical protein EST38_g8906 [Candolleomyces aberdarensis]|uniref:Uncharacterized protein n=1 Tax=Candolleomyces aberdarensis TaxID=2316362 RepID=A0A4Q2DDL9_9AGAR|nr:hypothetical protein EST38_g8906 [Candolleomyces aberdarensis]
MTPTPLAFSLLSAAIRMPCPPEVQEHVKKSTVLAMEEPWLHYERSVPVEGEQVEGCQICRKITAREEAAQDTNGG